MRPFVLLAAGLFAAAFSGKAQTVSTFENLTLPGTDTAYINYSQPGQDVGFASGLAYFPCVYDVSGGYSYWSYGFAYSNRTDSTHGGLSYQYAARPARAAAGNNYVVAYGLLNNIRLTGAARGNTLSGVYVTNNNYAYYSMLNGDAFARKFGDTTGTRSGLPQGSYPDYFKMVFRGYRSGALTNDSVEFYLADYRGANSAADYIVKDWKWVSLTALGHVDSVQIQLRSSDNGAFGMNTPAYFCLDNFTTNETNLSVGKTPFADLRIYPNPATENLTVAANAAVPTRISVIDLSGRTVISVTPQSLKTELSIGHLPSGMYQVLVQEGQNNASHRFVKP